MSPEISCAERRTTEAVACRGSTTSDTRRGIRNRLIDRVLRAAELESQEGNPPEQHALWWREKSRERGRQCVASKAVRGGKSRGGAPVRTYFLQFSLRARLCFPYAHYSGRKSARENIFSTRRGGCVRVWGNQYRWGMHGKEGKMELYM